METYSDGMKEEIQLWVNSILMDKNKDVCISLALTHRALNESWMEVIWG